MAAGIKLADTWLTVELDESEAPIKAEKVKVRRPTQDGAHASQHHAARPSAGVHGGHRRGEWRPGQRQQRGGAVQGVDRRACGCSHRNNKYPSPDEHRRPAAQQHPVVIKDGGWDGALTPTERDMITRMTAIFHSK